MNIVDLHARISQFVKNYGGKPPETNNPKSLDMISDFMLVIDAELDFIIKPKAELEPSNADRQFSSDHENRSGI